MRFPIIIGLCGLAGAGKDTVADCLVTHAGFSKIAFADALRNEVAAAFNLGDQLCILTDRETKEVPTNAMRLSRCRNLKFLSRMQDIAAKEQPDFDYDSWVAAPRSPRQIMQLWGTEYRRAMNENYWTNTVAMRILSAETTANNRWVITDCRFANEALAIRRIGGELWQVQRQNHTSVEGGHASQNDGSNFGPDCALLNGTTIIDLMHITLRMLQHRHGGLVLPDDLEAAA
jgi:hypothetical protein